MGASQLLVTAADNSRVFDIAAGATVTISGMAIEDGGGVNYGGAINNLGSLTLTDSTVSGSTAEEAGGGIYNGGTLVLTGDTFQNNTASNGGGAVYTSGSLTANNDNFYDNHGGISGGAISGATSNANITVTNSTITNNDADYGGGIFAAPGATTTITDSTLSSNTASLRGGGAIANRGDLTVTDSTLSGNSAQTGGGGIYNDGTATITNCTIYNNTASQGGGLDNLGSTTLTSCTVTDNNAYGGAGGGIFNSGESRGVSLENSIVSGNIDSTDPDIYGSFAQQDGFNLLGAALQGSTTYLTGDVFSDNPLLSPLGDYGGPTETVALLPGSPALTGPNSYDAYVSTTDQRGEGVPAGYYRDIGTFQSQGFTLTPIGGSDQNVGVDSSPELAVSVAANNPIEPVDGGVITFTTPQADLDSPGASIGYNYGSVEEGSAINYAITINSNTGGPYTLTTSADPVDSAAFHLTNILAATTTADNDDQGSVTAPTGIKSARRHQFREQQWRRHHYLQHSHVRCRLQRRHRRIHHSTHYRFAKHHLRRDDRRNLGGSLPW